MIDNIFITNFRRIKDADIELRDGITILIGKNGSGKSTVIEAITFVLFGKSKTGTKKETVRRSGASDDERTYVSLDFSLNELHYRCRRFLTPKGTIMSTLYSYTDEEYEKLKKQKNKTDLDPCLGTEVANSNTGVTNAVEELLGISYEGFCASFIAKQKELDSLANLTLENRKKFFLDLLGYSKLDVIKPELNKDLKAHQTAANIIEKQSLNATEIEKNAKAMGKQAAALDGRVEKGVTVVDTTAAKLKNAEERLNAMKAIGQQYDESQKIIDEGQKRLEMLSTSIVELVEKTEKDKKTAEDYDENSSISSKLLDARKALDNARAKVQCEQSIEKLEGARIIKKSSIDDLSEELANLESMTKKEPNLDEAQSKLTTSREKTSALRQEKITVEAAIESITTLLKDVDNGNKAKCPTCGSSIASKEGRAHLEEELKSNQDHLTSIKAGNVASEKAVKSAEEKLASTKMLLKTWQANANRIEQMKKDQEREKRELLELDAQIKTLKENLVTIPESKESVAALEDIAAKLSKQADREQVMKVAYYAYKEGIAALMRSQGEKEKLESEIAEKTLFVKENAGVAKEFSKVTEETATLSANLDKYRAVLFDLRQEQGVAHASLKSLDEQKNRAAQQAKDMSELLDTIEVAIGAKTVVEFLRENLPSRIAPRLSAEASQLLEIATDGAYNMLEIDDTYEVFVYTDTDIRPIAQMSGGESDIISLCIRIAIAKIILETTGISEQTFILDEIFGALDDGRKASACNALQNLGSFLSKILCITHIDEIKDMADWTYMVQQNEHGVSTVVEVTDQSELPSLSDLGDE